MAIALRGSAVVPTGNPTTGFSVTIPSSVLAGDLLFLPLTSRDSTGAGTLSVTDNDTGGNTWTKIANSTDHKATLWYKRATSATASKSVTVANAVGSTSGVLKCFSGGDSGATPYTNIAIESNASGNETHAGFTPANADSMVCCSVHNYDNDNAVTSLSFATLGATTATEKTSSGGSDCGCIFGHVLQAGAAAATGNLTWAQTDGNTYSITWAIKPAAALSLALAQGTFALTGQAVGLRWNRNLAANQGSFALTGHAVTLPGKVTDNLVSHWKFKEASDTTRNDSWGQNHAGMVGSNVTKVTGVTSDAAAFQESGHLRVTDNSSFNPLVNGLGGMVMFRLSASNTLDFPGIMGQWAHTDNRGWILRFDKGTNRYVFQVSPNGTGASAVGVAADAFGNVPTNAWHVIRFWFDPVAQQIGIQVNLGTKNTASYTNGTIFNSTADLEFGRLGTSENVIFGDLDFAYLWTRDPGDSIAAQVYNGGSGLELASPIANAGFDQVRKEGELVMLDSSRSVDDVGITSRLWEQLSGTSVTLSDTGAVNPTFTAPADPVTLVFRVTVQNALSQTASDQMSITIVDAASKTWLSHTPQEAGITAATLYNSFDSMPSPCMILRNGRVVASKGDVTLEGFTWSASKMLTAMVAARQIHLNNIELTDTIPGSDFPSSPTATLFQLLNMTSDYGLNLPSHSPGDHFAYNNGGISFLGDYLNTTFYNGQTKVQMLLNAFGTALNYEDLTAYAGTPSGWDGGWSKSTRDLARDAQLVLQGGVWEGTQILDADFCNTGLWQEQIPDAATASTDEDDEFYNQAGTTAIMKDGWSLGWWYLHPGVGVAVECIAMQGKFGTTVYISKAKGIIAVACNVGGATDDSAQTRIASSAFADIVNAATNAYQLAASSGSFTQTGQATSLLRALKGSMATESFSETGNSANLVADRLMLPTAGSFAETGNAINLLHGPTMVADAGSFSESGQAASLLRGQRVAIDAGDFALTGNGVPLLWKHLIELGGGVFTETGQNVNLVYTPAGGSVLSVDSGSFTETGFATGLLRGHLASLVSGALAESGQSVDLLKGHRISLTTGAFTETGNAADLLRGSLLDVGSGSFSETGQPVTLLRTNLLSLDTGSFAETGFSVGLIYTPAGSFLISIDSGAFSQSGVPVSLLSSRQLQAQQGTFSESGQETSLLRSYRSSADAGSFVETGFAQSLLHNWAVPLLSGSFSQTGFDVTFDSGRTMQMGVGTLALNGQALSLITARHLSVETGSLQQTGFSVSLLKGNAIAISVGSFAGLGFAVDLLAAFNLHPDAGLFTLTGGSIMLTTGQQILAPGVVVKIKRVDSNTILVPAAGNTVIVPAEE